MIKNWIPGKGDYIRADFDPQAGHEQAGSRPALVLSEKSYNQYGMVIVCPITNQAKGYPFEVAIPSGQRVTGVVLADQIKSMDWKSRNAKHLGGPAPKEIMNKVLLRLKLLVGFDKS